MSEQNTPQEQQQSFAVPAWPNPNGENINREYTILITGKDGVVQRRTFTMMPYSNAQRAYMLRLKREYASDAKIQEGKPITQLALIEYTLESSARVLEAMQAGYAGEMTGFDWFDADPELLEVMVTNFFVAFWMGLNRMRPS